MVGVWFVVVGFGVLVVCGGVGVVFLCVCFFVFGFFFFFFVVFGFVGFVGCPM